MLHIRKGRDTMKDKIIAILVFAIMITIPFISSYNSTIEEHNIKHIVVDEPVIITDSFPIDHGTRADGEDWLEGWNYRRLYNITGVDGAGINYQINLEAFYDFAYNRTVLTLESIQGIADFGQVVVHNDTLHFGAMNGTPGTELYFYTYNTSNETLTQYLLPHIGASSNGHLKPIVYRDMWGYWWAFTAYNTEGIYWMRTNYTDRFDEWNGSYFLVDQGTYVYPYQNEATGRLYIIHRKFGALGDNYTIDYTDDNGTTWIKNQTTIFPSNTGPHNCYYVDMFFDNITERLHVSVVGERTSGIVEVRDDLHYVYSDDYGTTWRDTNGTTVTNISDTIITTGKFSRTHMNIDSDNRPMFTAGLLNNSDRNTNFLDLYRLLDGVNWQITRISTVTSSAWGPKEAPVQIGDTIYVMSQADYAPSGGGAYPTVSYSNAPYTDWTRFDFNHTNTRMDKTVDNGLGYGVVNGTIYFIATAETTAADETYMFTFPFETDGSKFSLDAKCRTDFEDVWFTDNDGITELDYWMEYRLNGTFATFWIEVADNLNTSQSIYIYYGKPDARYTDARQHGEDTFIFFDGEGWGGEVDWTTKWQSTNHSKYNVENGILNFSRGNQDIYTDLIQSQDKYGNGMVFELYLQSPTTTSWTHGDFEENVATFTGKDKAIIKQAAPSLHLYLNNVGDNVGRSRDTEQYFKIKYFLPEEGNANLSVMGKNYFWFNELISAPAYRESYLGFIEILADSYSWMDNVFVRKYINISAGEPQTNFWDNEEYHGYNNVTLRDENNNTVTTFTFEDAWLGEKNVNSTIYYFVANNTVFWGDFNNFVKGSSLVNTSTNMKVFLFNTLSDAKAFTNVIDTGIADTNGNCSITGLDYEKSYFLRAEITQIPNVLNDTDEFLGTVNLLFGDYATSVSILNRMYTLILQKGWNLVSIPFVINKTISWILGYSEVTAFTVRNASNIYTTYTASNPSVELLVPGEGYYIYATEYKEIVLTETWRRNLTVNLTLGYNLIGVSYSKDKFWSSQTFLGVITGKTVTGRTSVKLYITYIKGITDNNFTIDIGRGYYVYVIKAEAVIL